MKHIRIRNRTSRRRGVVAIVVLALLPVLLGFAALTIDVGRLLNGRIELQNAVDAAVLAAVSQLPDEEAVREMAKTFASRNADYGVVLADPDIQLGNWDAEYAVFTPNGEPVNAVHALVRRADVNGNPVTLLFAGIFGFYTTDIAASATAAVQADCLDHGIKAGGSVSVGAVKFSFGKSSTLPVDICINGRQGVTVDQVRGKAIDGSTLTLSALDEELIVVNDPFADGVGIVKIANDIQPSRAQRVNELINEIEAGTVGTATWIVVLSGPAELRRADIAPHTAYVVNGDVTLPDKGYALGDVTIAARGSILFMRNVDLANSALVAALDVVIGYEDLADPQKKKHKLKVSGGTVIAGRDFISTGDLEIVPLKHDKLSRGASIEAGRDVVIRDEFKARNLGAPDALPLEQPSRSSLVE